MQEEKALFIEEEKELLIYVKLLNEDIDVWRPAKAKHIEKNIYYLLAQEYDTDIETWEFKPNTKVRCEEVMREHKNILIAIQNV